jgi:1-aminocyclopropane-1-carboxylate deaminase
LFELQSLLKPLTKTPWSGFPNVSIIRGDLLHPIVSGNKLFKLLPIVQKIMPLGYNTLLSVGGRYSNHLHAMAWVGKELGISTVGIVQGYREQEDTPTMADCRLWGMNIHYVDRLTFQQRNLDSFWTPWLDKYPNAYRVNEGGWSPEAVNGSRLWWEGIPEDTDIVVTPIGSGSTLAGLINSSSKSRSVIGVPVFNDPNDYVDLKSKLINTGVEESAIQLWKGYSRRGFGQMDDQLAHFQENFEQSVGVALDPVYTIKTFFALSDKLKNQPSLRSKKIAILHTGGLQGARTL